MQLIYISYTYQQIFLSGMNVFMNTRDPNKAFFTFSSSIDRFILTTSTSS